MSVRSDAVKARKKAWNAAYRAANPAYNTAYRAANAEKIRTRKAAYRAANPERSRAPRLRKYGLTPESYDRIFWTQGWGCAMCGQLCKTGVRLAVDHNHTTGHVRGLLCQACNTGIGKLKDSPKMLAIGLQYFHIHGESLTTEELAKLIKALSTSIP